ncbi:HNH endonuclease [Halopiger xanaduensis]|uniref:Uncharacterized protein n=1 Tax=Halopiger xanaduensis (strain DSM 18323 / JCM 14033 / SH-6) TaxID=797210 RepID=F8D4J1_HALXS|nr:HNH endonuclease [Halopiger xanaduensis]AEH36319.1 hypothetical protein Halxa_1687 [Halopiger xanaduensis SH-6]
MTSRERDREPEWRGDRAAVLERDDRTCRRCGADGDDPSTLRCYPVGDVPLEGAVHESALVTVCSSCFTALQNPVPAEPIRPNGEELFDLARETTQRQGVTVSAVASFASLATSLPGELAAAGAAADGGAATDDESAVDPDGGEDDDSASASDPASEYVTARREVLLAIDSVPSRLERLSAIEQGAIRDDLVGPLEELVDAATRLQTELGEIVARSETVPASLDRCHGCLEPLGDEVDRCPICDLERRDAAARVGDDGTVAFEDLYTAINETLQDAAGTTEELTESAATLADGLRGE